MNVASTRELNYVRQLLLDEEVDLAIKELRNLQKRYPNDALVLYELGTTLLRQDINVSEALYLLSLATNEHNKYAISNEMGTYFLNHGKYDEAIEKFSFLDNSEKEKDRCYGLHGLIMTYIHTGDYDKALACFDRLKIVRRITDFDVSHYYNLKFYLLTMNNLNPNEAYADNYFRKQLVEYDKEAAIEHIKEHLRRADEEELKTKKVHSVFNENIDIEKLYDYCLEKIKDLNPSGRGIVDYYKCQLDDKVGATYANKETTYVEVVTFPNTKQILSIYPVFAGHVNKVAEQKEKERRPYKPKKKTYRNNKKKH